MCEFNLNESQSKLRGFGREKNESEVGENKGENFRQEGLPSFALMACVKVKFYGGRSDRSFGTAPFPRFLL